MTHRGGLKLSIIIWRIRRKGAKFPFALEPKNSLGGTGSNLLVYRRMTTVPLHNMTANLCGPITKEMLGKDCLIMPL